MLSISELPEIDFSSEAYQKRPFQTLAEHARKWRIARSKRGVEILDYDICRNMILDRRFGTGHPKLMHLLGLPEGRALNYKRESISFYNRGDKRRKLRQPIARLMSPHASEAFRQDIKDVVADIISDIPTHTRVDLIEALCDPTPSRVYCYWVGADKGDASYIARTSHTVQRVHTRDPEKTPEIVEAFESLLDYADARIAAAREAPSDNLISDLVRAANNGEFTDDDLRNWVIKLAEANTDNSSHQIASTIIELASRPAIWQRLREDPDAIPIAVNEVMRIHPRSISTSREALEDVEIDGVHIAKGTPVFANIGAAHWDERYYPEPEKFSLERAGQPAHLNFGGGVFSCLGRYAITIEVEEVVRYMTQSFPRIRLDKAEFSHSPMFTNVTDLHATLAPLS